MVIIGAGPAGLTAAWELAEAGVRDVVVLEATRNVGGLSQSVEYKGNRIDIGGHRFFSKSDWVMDWWTRMLPLAASAVPGRRRPGPGARLPGQAAHARARPPRRSETDARVMLVRKRLSRIYFDGKFFDYPLKANVETALKLGLWRCARFGASYAWAMLFPRRPERSLEDFFINRFGRLPLPAVLQGIHREGLGHALRPDQRGVGRAAHQEPVHRQGAAARAAQAVSPATAAWAPRSRPR